EHRPSFRAWSCAHPFATRLDPRRQLLPAAHRRRTRHLGRIMIDLPVGPARQYLFEGDTALESSETCAETEVGAVAEAQVVDVLARHVQTIGVRELALVPIRRTVRSEERRTLGHARPVQVDVP